MEKQDFIDFATRILKLEEDKKEIGVEIKESIEGFATSNGLNKKTIKKAVAQYKEYLKDESEFCEIDAELGNIINSVVYSEFTQEG